MTTVEPVYYTRQDVANYTANKLDNNLCKYLLTYCGLDAHRLNNILRDYCVGSIDGGIIFWQIDEQFRIHRGKVMWYNPDGHRTKILSSDGTERGKIKAMWQYLKRDRKNESEMWYFGQHLITVFFVMTKAGENEIIVLNWLVDYAIQFRKIFGNDFFKKNGDR